MNKKLYLIIAIISVIAIIGLSIVFYIDLQNQRILESSKIVAENDPAEILSVGSSKNYIEKLMAYKDVLSEEIYNDLTKDETVETLKTLEEKYGYKMDVRVDSIESLGEENNIYSYIVSVTEITTYTNYNRPYELSLKYSVQVKYEDKKFIITKLERLDDAGE